MKASEASGKNLKTPWQLRNGSRRFSEWPNVCRYSKASTEVCFSGKLLDSFLHCFVFTAPRLCLCMCLSTLKRGMLSFVCCILSTMCFQLFEPVAFYLFNLGN